MCDWIDANDDDDGIERTGRPRRGDRHEKWERYVREYLIDRARERERRERARVCAKKRISRNGMRRRANERGERTRAA